MLNACKDTFIKLLIFQFVLLKGFTIAKSISGRYLGWRSQRPQEYKLICYMTNWAQYRPEKTKFVPENIDPFLCTHIIYAFAAINTTTFEIKAFEWNDESKDNKMGRYEELNNLKNKNPKLKTLLAVGGWNMGSQPFSDMAVSEKNRQIFIRSTVKFLRKWNFDGLDIDWEFPAKREGSRPQDKESLNYLVKEIRDAFYNEAIATRREQLLLSLAVSAEKNTIIGAYDIGNITPNLDFISIMSYDYHGSWDNKLGHNSPLRSTSYQNPDDNKLSNDFTVKLFLTLGVPREKLILGIPFYGRSFTKNKNSNHIGAEATGSGSPGEYTREGGFLSFFEVCNYVKFNNWTRVWSTEHMTPYAYNETQWVGYDDEESIRVKTEYVVRHCLGGAMIWSIDLDDFGNFCYDKKYPLTNIIGKTLKGMNRTRCSPLESVQDSDVVVIAEKTRSGLLMDSMSPVEIFLDNLYDEIMNITIEENINLTSNYSTDEDMVSLNGTKIESSTIFNEYLDSHEIPSTNTNNSLNYVDEDLLKLIMNKQNKENDEENANRVSVDELKNAFTSKIYSETTSTREMSTEKKKSDKLTCEDKQDGDLIPDPEDCSSFYTCYLGNIVTRRKCTNDLYFDANLKVCNWPSMVQCVKRD